MLWITIPGHPEGRVEIHYARLVEGMRLLRLLVEQLREKKPVMEIAGLFPPHDRSALGMLASILKDHSIVRIGNADIGETGNPMASIVVSAPKT